MNNQTRFFLILALIVVSLSIYFGAFRVEANSTGAINNPDRTEMKRLIIAYFEARYQSFQNLVLSDFAKLTINNYDTRKELDKLDLVIYQHKVNQLKYQQYEYFLDFGEVTINSVDSTANVKVIEGSDVFYENSSLKPTKIRNIKHIISLQKVNENWKIFSDKYEDDFWRMLRNTNLTNAEIRTKIENFAKQNTLIATRFVPVKSVTTLNFETCTVQGVNVCYNRDGAKDYANNHASIFSRNQDYVWFDGNDCTNFVSQAMYLGGGISQYFPNINYGELTSDGWYYNDEYYRSSSWAGVEQFHAFLVPVPNLQRRYNYLGGPIARELNQYDPNDLGNLQIGDIIQFDWTCYDENGCDYDHSVIVVDLQSGIYVDSHTDDALHKNIYEYYPWNKIRYIHINDDLYRPFVYIPAIKGGQMIPQLASSSAYPAPLQNALPSKQKVQPYPAP